MQLFLDIPIYITKNFNLKSICSFTIGRHVKTAGSKVNNEDPLKIVLGTVQSGSILYAVILLSLYV